MKVVSAGNATVKVDGVKYAAGKAAEYDKNDEDVVITVTADKGYTVKTVKVDSKEVDLDKNGEYTISKIKGLYTVEVTTEAEAAATMKILVTYQTSADVIKGQESQTVNESATEGFAEVKVATPSWLPSRLTPSLRFPSLLTSNFV